MTKQTLTDKFRNWAPRAHKDRTEPKHHQAVMPSIGHVDSKWLYFNPWITAFAAGGVWGFVIWAMVAQEDAAQSTADAQTWVTDVWNWLYMFSQNVWIVVLCYILYKYYNLKLGKDDEEPEFSDLAYFAMLFSCGVATGLWYFTAEPMWHYEGYGGPRWTDREMWNDNTRAEHALMVTFFHWGPHGWIPYTVVGALIAILSYRRGFPMSMRFTLYPLIGEMCYGRIGDLVEVLSILCTIFGVCTSLGLGAMQINKGLVRLDRGTYHGSDTLGCESPDHMTCSGRVGIQENALTQILIILLITLCATASVVLGLKRGIQALSMIAFALSLFILLSVLLMDNTWYILNALTSTLGYYFWYLPKISFHTDAWEELGKAAEGLGGAPDGRGGSKGWMNSWTIFYWGWWISWGPFVGTFLARISKGRKLGHFIIASLVLPSLWSFLFMGIFGAAQIRISNEAIAAGLTGDGAALTYGSMANKSQIGYNMSTISGTWEWEPVADSTVRLYSLATEDVLFEHLGAYGGENYATFMTVITLICIVLYFVTSSDSASFVVDILAANGIEEPPVGQKIFWAFTEGAAAAALLASAGEDDPKAALNAVKALPIILGLPFTFLLFWMCQGLLIVCQEETGVLQIERKNFTAFLFNLEPPSFLAILFPFVPLGQVSEKTWGGSRVLYTIAFATAWLAMFIFAGCTLADEAFGYMAAAMYFMLAFAAAGLRVAVRAKLGITGGMISDVCVCCFALPWAIGQMAVEDFVAVAEKEVVSEPLSGPERNGASQPEAVGTVLEASEISKGAETLEESV